MTDSKSPGGAQESDEIGLASTALSGPSPGPKPHEHAAPGEVLGGRYEIIAELGRGASGVVLKARDRVAAETVALKLLSGGIALAPAMIERFRRELRSARKVTHSGVVRMHDLLELEGGLALSMELIEGETLQARLARAPKLASEELLHLAADLADALAAAHRSGVTHRDLKPANVILRASTARPVITDFGISRLREAADPAGDSRSQTPGHDSNLTQEGELIGTPLYMAPEQLLGRSDVSSAADVFALGLLLFEAATGRVPAASASVGELVQQRLSGPPVSLASERRDLPAAFCAVVDRCLRPAVADRYRDGVEVRDALAALTPAGARERPLRRARGGVFWAALGLAGAALTALGSWWWIGRLPPRDRRVAVIAANHGPREDDRLIPAVTRLSAQAIGRRSPRFRVTDDRAQANVLVEIAFDRRADRSQFEVSLGPAKGRRSTVFQGTASSAAEALETALPSLRERLEAGQPEPAVDPRELREAKRAGARNILAHRELREVERRLFGAIIVDLVALEASLDRIIASDPTWARPRAALAIVQGLVGPKPSATIQAARASADPGRDSVGHALIGAIERLQAGHLEEITALLDGHWAEEPPDAIAGYLLFVAHYQAARVDDLIGVSRRLNDSYPELQFGSDLAGTLIANGRAEEVPALIEHWVARAPDNEQALSSKISVEAERGRLDEAERLARAILWLHGEAPHRTAALCDLLLFMGRTREARELADRLLAKDPISRARGRYRTGVAAILEGRFSAAYDSLAAAIDDNRPLGIQSETPQAIEAIRGVAPMVGRTHELPRWTEELASAFDRMGAKERGSAIRAEAALLREGKAKCPELEAALASAGKSAAEEKARVELLRTEAAAACVGCDAVVAAGLGASEQGTAGLLRLGLCAEQKGELDLASRALNSASRLRTVSLALDFRSSPLHAVLARFHLARLRERMGDIDGARDSYQWFLARWGSADRPVAEVGAARLALVRLRSPNPAPSPLNGPDRGQPRTRASPRSGSSVR
ncbi:MAG: protein kinase [Myxococcales bacterium]|nr:protein kinase [Myxococcales bacterium]